MKSVIGILAVTMILFFYNMHLGTDVVALSVVTLCLWHGIWRLLDHIESVFEVDEKPLISAIVSISVGGIIAFWVNKFHPHKSFAYLEKRF